MNPLLGGDDNDDKPDQKSTSPQTIPTVLLTTPSRQQSLEELANAALKLVVEKNLPLSDDQLLLHAQATELYLPSASVAYDWDKIRKILEKCAVQKIVLPQKRLVFSCDAIERKAQTGHFYDVMGNILEFVKNNPQINFHKSDMLEAMPFFRLFNSHNRSESEHLSFSSPIEAHKKKYF